MYHVCAGFQGTVFEDLLSPPVCVFMLHLTWVAAVRISASKTPMAELVMTEDVRHDLEEGCNLGQVYRVREASG